MSNGAELNPSGATAFHACPACPPHRGQAGHVHPRIEMNQDIQTIDIEDHWIESENGRLFARLWTPRSRDFSIPLILLHDSLGSVELWRDFPAALSAQTRRPVIAYDRRGFGRSDAYSGKLSLDFIATEADTGFAAICRQLGIDRFVLFGHSVGGGMAVHCAAKRSDACIALITESAQAFVEDRTLRGIEEARELFADPAQVARLAKYHGDKAQWVLDAWIGSWLSPAFASWSLDSVLPQLKCPLLVIHGMDDEYGSARHPERIAALASGPVQLELMHDTRHVPHRERAAEVIERVTGFLQAIA